MTNKIARLLLCVGISLGALGPAALAMGELPREVRVVTYNIHHGEGTDGKIDLERIAKLLMAESPHLVAVNEVDQGAGRTHRIDMPAELARLTGLEAVFEKNIDFDGGEYGNAVLSRLPILRHENHKLPSHYQGEQRGVLEVEVGGADESLLFLATHFDYRPADDERLASVEKVEQVLQGREDRLAILAGDLNAAPDSQVLVNLLKHWKNTAQQPLPSFPAGKPTKQIDYILVRPAEKWEVVETRILDAPGESDHRPLLSVLRRME
ncbi:MAG: endonuclease/exonuclease/phosphatase family protein [Pirellulales bacterium]|nr:endonuclease/exonuclease/phosphatase family protein [Pirellulales bacterium]